VPALVIVDGANVVGSVPDGWWRDRLGAARRLRDALAGVPAAGLDTVPGPVEVVLVVEGAAAPLAAETPRPPSDANVAPRPPSDANVASPEDVRVVAAPTHGSGDDAIVDLVAASPDRRSIVVTSDRGLRIRVTALGADVVGPRSLPYP
jgi:hypothetical protein